MYRVFEALDELVTTVEQARSLPMTAGCVVPRGDVLELLDDVREALPGELDDAQDVIDHRDSLVAEATEEAETARSDARTEADRVIAEAREQAQQMIAEAEHEAERIVSRGRREYAELTERAEAEADRMAEAGRQSYERQIDEGRAEQARLVGQHEVAVAARVEGDRLVDAATDEADRRRSECDHYVDATLSEFSETLESVLDTVGRHRHQLRVGGGHRDGHDGHDGSYRERERVGA